MQSEELNEILALNEAVQSAAGAVLRNSALLQEKIVLLNSDPEPVEPEEPTPPVEEPEVPPAEPVVDEPVDPPVEPELPVEPEVPAEEPVVPPVEPEVPEEPAEPSLPNNIPARDWMPVDPSSLTRTIEGGYTMKPGEVLQNVHVKGTLTLPSGGGTVRNVKVTTGTTAHGVTQLQQSGVPLGDCNIDGLHVVLTNREKGANSGIAVRQGTVKNFRVDGCGDGFKAWHNTDYDTFVLIVSKVPGSEKHADGIQNSGKSNITVRNGYVENGRLTNFNGGHAAAFVQAFNGSSDIATENVLFENVFLNGGQFLIATGEGKTQRSGLLKNIVFKDILLGRDFFQAQGRPLNVTGDVKLVNIRWADTGEAYVRT